MFEISKIKNCLAENPDIIAAYLFGSAAGGERVVNDLDILVLLDLLQFSWRRGSKDSRGQGVKCLLSNDLIIVLSIFLTFAKLEGMPEADLTCL